MRIHDNPQQGSPPRKAATVGEQRVISDYCSHTDQNGVMLMSKQLNMRAGFVTGDPATGWSSAGKLCAGQIIWRWRDLAVQSHRSFQCHQRQAIADVLRKCIIQWPSFLFQQARSDLHPGLSKPCESTSADCGIWISCTRHHAFYSRGDQHVGARSGAAMMATRFEIDVKGRTTRLLAGLFQSQDFGMLLSIVRVETLT